jgi:hypothetical protein
MRKYFLQIAFMFFLFSFTASAQTVVGTWKRTGNMLIMDDGSKKDMQKMLLKAMPCQAGIQYIFTATGKNYTESPKGCGAGDEMSRATYHLSGNILTLTPEKDMGMPFTSDYTITFSGDNMTLSHVYTESEKSALHSKAKKIIITYQKA